MPEDADAREELAARGASGDHEACRLLAERLWPEWIGMVRSNRRMGALAQSEDHVHNVVVRLVEKIVRPDNRGLKLYVRWRERNEEKAFDDWLRIVTANAVRDYVREQLGTRRASKEEPSAKRFLNEFASSGILEELGIRPPLTQSQTARELLEFAKKRLDAATYRALHTWLEGARFEDIAEEMKISAAEARNLLRAGIAVLRRHFATGP